MQRHPSLVFQQDGDDVSVDDDAIDAEFEVRDDEGAAEWAVDVARLLCRR